MGWAPGHGAAGQKRDLAVARGAVTRPATSPKPPLAPSSRNRGTWAAFEVENLPAPRLRSSELLRPEALRQRGYDARALVGGITAWHAIGGTTVPLDISTYEEAP